MLRAHGGGRRRRNHNAPPTRPPPIITNIITIITAIRSPLISITYGSLSHQFLIVKRLDAPNDQYMMQVLISDDFSTYHIEYREGGSHAHFQAEVDRERDPWVAQDEVAKIFAQWAFERDGWREALPGKAC